MSGLRSLTPGAAGPLRAMGLPSRGVLLGLSLCCGAVFIGLATLVLPKDSKAAVVLLDYSSATIFPYPITIQNFMHLAFFLGLGEVFVRSMVALWERRFDANLAARGRRDDPRSGRFGAAAPSSGGRVRR
ncbi:MAG: hypothetical protein R2724_22520 [Bryobacterales bacterium]